MAKFNRTTTRPATFSPVTSETTPSGRTHEGAPGYARDAKSELFLLAVSNMVGENTFYEKAGDRDDRFLRLVREIALTDPVWLYNMLVWLREDANMRSAPLVGACEMVKARLDAGADQVILGAVQRGVDRLVIDSVCKRADEPGELLAYWNSTYGRAIPKPVKRGLGDAVQRLYNERALLKYDTASKGFRFGDVIDLVHPTPAPDKPWQGALFQYALDRRHNRGNLPDPDALGTLAYNLTFLEAVGERPERLLDADAVKRAGLTWENALSLAGSKVDKKALWEALIPSMGLMALTRNLRNFDQAGVSDEAAAKVAARLADPDEVRRSRQFPFRFLAAHRAAPSLRWSYPLEKALGHSLGNVPALKGRTLVLVDRSPSMWWQRMSERSDMPWADAAAVFGAAVAIRAENADLVEFGFDSAVVRFGRSESLLKILERFTQRNGTDIPSAVRAHYKGHDRVVIVTDEQTRAGWLPSNAGPHGGMPETRIDDLVPKHVPVYMWNFAGYRHGAAPSGSGNRHAFGGLSDSAFRLIPLLEAGRNAAWPWLLAS